MKSVNLDLKLNKRLIKIVGGGLTGIETAYICAKNGYRVHIFNKPQNELTYFDKEEPFANILQEELFNFSSPTYLTSQRMGENILKLDKNFIGLMREKLKEFPNVSYIESEIDELNPREITLLATGNNTTNKLLDDLTKYIGERKIQYYSPGEIAFKNIKEENLFHDKDNNYHLNLTESEYAILKNKMCKFLNDYEVNNLLGQQISGESLARNEALRTAIFRPIYNENCKAYASLKLRKHEDIYYLTEFFTALSNEEQKEIFSGISALDGAEFVNFGKIYKRTYLSSAMCVNNFLQFKNEENFFVCGGLLGVEGVMESLLTANYVAYNLMNMAEGKTLQEITNFSCTKLLIDKLLQKNVLNHRLLSFDYDIINDENGKNIDTSAVLKFKEKFYGKYF